MKTLLSSLAAALLIISCQKSIDATDALPTNKCRVVRMEYELDSTIDFVRVFSYDSLKRIRSIVEDMGMDSTFAFYEGNTARLVRTIHSWDGPVSFFYNSAGKITSIEATEESVKFSYVGNRIDSATLFAPIPPDYTVPKPRIMYKFVTNADNSVSSYRQEMFDGVGQVGSFEYESRENPLRYLAPFDIRQNLFIGPLLPLSNLGYADEYLLRKAVYKGFGQDAHNFESRYEYEFDAKGNLIVCKLAAYIDGQYTQTTRLLFSYECD